MSIVQRIGHWQPVRPSSLSLERLFSQLTLLLEKILRAESISLELPTDNRFEALVPAGDLWLVMLTLINQGRHALQQNRADANTAKLISISVELTDQQDRIRLWLSNSSGTWLEGDNTLWPDRPFCTQLLQQHQATLQEHPKGAQIRLSLEIPCRNSAA